MKKYLNYGLFLLIVVVVAGMAVNHSRHISALVNAMAGDDRTARIKAAKELVLREQFMDSVTGETAAKRVRIVQALEDWAGSGEPNGKHPSDEKKTFGPKDTVKQLVAFLKDPDKPVRDRIMVALLRTGALDADGLQEIVTGLKEGDANLRRGCVVVLQVLGQKDAQAAAALLPKELLPVLGQDDPVTAAQAIMEKRKPEVVAQIVPKVVEILKKEGGARASGGDVLGKLTAQREESVATLRPLLSDKDEGVRTGAADAMGKVGSPSALPDLIGAMKSGTAQVRRVAIGAIALIADRGGEGALIEALNNPNDDNEARAQAAVGLGRIATDGAIRTLIKALSDFDLKVQVAAVSALARAGKPALAPLLATLSDKTQPKGVRSRAAQALAGMDTPDANPGLSAALNDPEAEVREEAALALGFENNAPAVQPLLTLLADKDGSVAMAVADALAQIGAPGRDALARTLSSSVPTVAYYAALSLGKQEPAAVTAVKQAVETAPNSHRWAIVSLNRIGGPDAVKVLKGLQKQPDPETQQAAGLALKKLGAE